MLWKKWWIRRLGNSESQFDSTAAYRILCLLVVPPQIPDGRSLAVQTNLQRTFSNITRLISDVSALKKEQLYPRVVATKLQCKFGKALYRYKVRTKSQTTQTEIRVPCCWDHRLTSLRGSNVLDTCSRDSLWLN